MRPKLWFLLLAILAVFCSYLSGQDTEKHYNIQGTVINGRTGAPIVRALVVVQDRQPKFTLTDDYGRFKFEAVSVEPVRVMAGKAGFLGELSQANFLPNSGTVIDSKTASVLIKLWPEASIQGRITSPDGDPLEGVPVDLFYLGSLNGEEVRLTRGSTSTRQDGTFVFEELGAGRYFIMAGPKVSEPLIPVQHSQIPRNDYAVSFYPGVSDPHDATPIQLAAGQSLSLDFPLRKTSFFTVSGRVTGWTAGDYGVLQFQSSAGNFSNYSTWFDSTTGAFQVRQVPPGSYTIRVLNAQKIATAEHLIVNSDVTGLKLEPSDLRMIPVIVHAKDRGAEGASPGVRLEPQDKWQDTVTSSFRQEQSGPTQVLAQPLPGTYRVHFWTGPPLYVAAASCGATDLLREPLEITEQQMPPIEVTVGYETGRIRGQVNSHRRPASAFVAALRLDPPGETVSAGTSPEGSFGELVVAPGKYRVWAFNHAPPYFKEAGALDRYAASGQDVVVTPHQTTTVNLELLEVDGDDE